MPQVIYGRNAVYELLRTKPDTISKIYFPINMANDKRLNEMLIIAKQNQVSIGKASNQKLGDFAKTDKHQGVVALTDETKIYDLDDILAENPVQPRFFLILDSIEDPQNLGAILRSAEAAGVDAVLIPKDFGAPINSTVHKTSAGATAYVRICRVGNLSQTMIKLKKHQIWVVGTDLQATKSYTDFDYSMNIALVIGSEGKGMRHLVRETCDELVKIPIRGKIQSLNASVSAGIMLYEVVRQRILSKKL
ncbi:MAG: 23S rRNA (guanosine(2251)-2'-O)-methyltransferase RlmB [Chloroherpetonaceae bacterium]|nr:23S rRNA (guanosine(2251)-2'-O)-methyltransferase RlmB [Chloroherpetonaceae bacterium]